MIKRLFDIYFSALGLVILFPLFVLIALLIKSNSSGPVFFRQIRMGQGFRQFRIYKFRTMVVDAEQKGAQVSSGGDPRITSIGTVLRRYKLDELPQLVNVLLGDMSLVGPRPEVPRYVDAFREEYREVLSVKPGITDFASLEYKDENELLRGVENPEEKYLNEILPAKIEFYRKYIREQGLVTDVILIIRTVVGIFR